jgi:hemerythrin
VVTLGAEHATGIHEIDEQHAHIAELINAVDAAATTGAGVSTIDLVLGLLTRYLEVHFQAEERLMRSVGYPALTAHAAHHRWCGEQVDGLLQGYRDGKNGIDAPLNFVRDWMANHTLTRDKEFAAFVRGTRSASGTAPGQA